MPPPCRRGRRQLRASRGHGPPPAPVDLGRGCSPRRRGPGGFDRSAVSDGNLVQAIERGDGRVVLVIIPHADDAAIRCGGTIVLWAQMGWRVIVLRVTDDSTDSVGLDRL